MSLLLHPLTTTALALNALDRNRGKVSLRFVGGKGAVRSALVAKAPAVSRALIEIDGPALSLMISNAISQGNLAAIEFDYLMVGSDIEAWPHS